MKLVSCGYRNSSDRMVIARCLGPEAFFLERVVFPFELLSFECPDDSQLEIWTHGLGGAELVELIPTAELLIDGLPEAVPPDSQEGRTNGDPSRLKEQSWQTTS